MRRPRSLKRPAAETGGWMISVGIVNRDSLALLGLQFLFKEQRDIRIALAANRPLPLAGLSLDCLVIDLNMIRDLRLMLAERKGAGVSRRPRVVGLTGVAVPWDGSDVAEVDAICRREDAARTLVREVLRLNGPDGSTENVCDATAKVSLSPREEEVLHHLAFGFTHDQVARRIGISRHTVDTYVKRLRSKLDAGNKAQLVNAAWRLHTADPGAGA